MSNRKKWISWLTAALVLFAMPLSAFALELPQDIPGSIELTVCWGDKPIPGGKMTCIQVGEVGEDNGNSVFLRCLDGKLLTNVQSKELAAELEKFANEHQLPGTICAIGENGTVKFSNLKIGLYLLVQETPAPGYSKLAPFLVSVPYLEEGKYQYDVTPLVKAELKREPVKTPPKTVPDESLPQTGQLNWPVPVMTAVGLLLFSAGWALRFGKKKESNEK